MIHSKQKIALFTFERVSFMQFQLDSILSIDRLPVQNAVFCFGLEAKVLV